VRLERPVEARHAYEHGLSLGAISAREKVELQVRIAALDVSEGRTADALRTLEDAVATARASGQTDIANDADATIQALRRRISGSK
jgi:polysaccharide deacetylase 2 family uncharacterized protein YibQ